MKRLQMPLIIYSFLIFISCAMDSTDKEIEPGFTVEGKTYLALGDSYTIGQDVEIDERWPVQLVNKARVEGYDLVDPVIVATTGWTTDELQQGISTAGIDNQTYDFVSLLIGVNNQFRGYPFSQFEKEFNELLDYAIIRAGGDDSGVFVVSIPDYGVTPFGKTRDSEKIATELDEYNLYQQEICKERNIQFFNITSISREALDSPELIASDNLHPSGEMYRRWVDEVIGEWFLQQLAP